jgi:hypothetical protein
MYRRPGGGSIPRTLALLMVAALAGSIVGCGDDDAGEDAGGDDVEVSDDAQPYVDAMIESFDNSDPDELQIDREQAQCLAPRWVETIGPDRLAEAGIEPEDFSSDEDVDLSTTDLSEDDGNEMYDAFEACRIDVKNLFVQSMATDEELTAEDAECLEGAVDDDLLRRILVTTFVEGEDALDRDEELTGELFAVFAECPGAAGEG